MKRKLIILLSCIIGIIVIVSILNIEVNTRQGVNYSVSNLKIPLYLKVLDFFDRHYNYKWTVQRIISDSRRENEKVLKIFEWTHKNIKRMPAGFPVIDDHVWNIIVRGYGKDDQFADVFTTLCNYAGLDAFFGFIKGEDNDRRIALSFVEIKGRWHVFDPYNGIYFKNNEKGLADLADIVKGDWLIESIDSSDGHNIDYAHYLKNIQRINSSELTRSNTQSPFNRLKYEIKKTIMKGKYKE